MGEGAEMRVAKDDTIAGVNAKVLRDYFRRLRGRSFIAEDMVVELGMSPEEARQLAERLRAEGFVVPEAHLIAGNGLNSTLAATPLHKPILARDSPGSGPKSCFAGSSREPLRLTGTTILLIELPK
jgi:hypothetical protein